MQKAIIVDIDGTIAQKHPDRDIYDLTKVHMDLPIMPVIKVINNFGNLKSQCACGCDEWNYDYNIIYVSGRQEDCRKQTREWLYRHAYVNSTFDPILYMRKLGDNRCDTIVKREIYEEYIKGKYDVIAVFDDRPKVIRMWRELGLFVFNCAQHDEEF